MPDRPTWYAHVFAPDVHHDDAGATGLETVEQAGQPAERAECLLPRQQVTLHCTVRAELLCHMTRRVGCAQEAEVAPVVLCGVAHVVREAHGGVVVRTIVPHAAIWFSRRADSKPQPRLAITRLPLPQPASCRPSYATKCAKL